MEFGAAGAILAGAMLLVMTFTGGQDLETLKTIVSTSPGTWQGQIGGLSWPARIFGLSCCVMIAAFFSNEVAGAFGSLVILNWIVNFYKGGWASDTGAASMSNASEGHY